MTFFVLALVVLTFLIYASYSIRSKVYIKTFSSNKQKGKVIALTFDDGPTAQTEKVLDVLKENNVKACFFCIGERIEGHEFILERMSKEEHLIGNHSYKHVSWFPMQSTKRIINDLQKCDEEIVNAIGLQPKFFRPPFGVTNPMIGSAVKKLGYHTIGWNIRSFDTTLRSHEKILKRIKRKLKPGSVLLLHDRLEESDVLLREILKLLEKEEYRIVMIDELFDIKSYI